VSREEWMEPAERWAWAEICAGRVANFNEREHNIIASGSSRGWTDLRKLRSEFIRSILFREQYKNLIPVEGIRIAGAWFQDPVDVAYGRLTHQLWLTDCRFEEAVNLQGLVVDGWLAFDGSTFASQSQDPPSLNLEDVKVA